MKNLIALASIALLAGCHDVDNVVVKGKIKDFWPQISNDEFLRTRGVGVPPASAKGSTRRRGLSRNAGLVAARYEMLATLKGVRLEGGLSIGDLMDRSSKIREIANRVVSGTEERQVSWADDDGCVVTIEISRAQVEFIMERDRAFEAPPVPKMAVVPSLPGMAGAWRVHESTAPAAAAVVIAGPKQDPNGWFYTPDGAVGLGLTNQP